MEDPDVPAAGRCPARRGTSGRDPRDARIGGRSQRFDRQPVTPALDELEEHARRGPTRSLTAVIAVVRSRAASASVDRRRVGGRRAGTARRCRLVLGLPPAAASNRACGSPSHGSPTSSTCWHTLSPSGPSRSGDRPRGCCSSHLRVAGGPVPSPASVLGAGQDRQPLVDIAVDDGELACGIPVMEVSADPRRTGLRFSTIHASGRCA